MMKYAGLSVVSNVVQDRKEVVRCCFKRSGYLDCDYTMIVSDGIEKTGGFVACSFSN